MASNHCLAIRNIGFWLSCDDVILVTANVPNEHTIEGALNSGASSRRTIRGSSLLAILVTTCPKLSTALSFSTASPMKWTKPDDRPQQIEIESLEEAGKPSCQLRLPALIHVDQSDGCSFVAVRQSPLGQHDGWPILVTDFLVCATF